MSERRKLGLFSLGVLALVAAAVGASWWHSDAAAQQERLSAAVATLDAADPGWRLEEIEATRAARIPPAESNAAEQILAALRLAPREFSALVGAAPGRAGISNRPSDLLASGPGRALFEKCRPAFEAARRVRTLPDGGSPFSRAPTSHRRPISAAAALGSGSQLLRLDAIWAAHERRGADAAGACVALVNLASGEVGDEPYFHSQESRIECALAASSATEQVLAWCGPPAADLAELQTRLASELAAGHFVTACRGERAACFELLNSFAAGRESLDKLFEARKGMGVGELPPFPARREVPGAQAALLEFFGDLIATAARPDPERAAGFGTDFDRRYDWVEGDRVRNLVWRYIPAATGFARTETDFRARLSCAVAAVACERFRAAHGRWPAALAELTPELLPAVPIDPYTGEPILYRVHPDGAAVYSTGPDKTDDGASRDWAIIPDWFPPETDIIFRLWNPPMRGALKSAAPEAR